MDISLNQCIVIVKILSNGSLSNSHIFFIIIIHIIFIVFQSFSKICSLLIDFIISLNDYCSHIAVSMMIDTSI